MDPPFQISGESSKPGQITMEQFVLFLVNNLLGRVRYSIRD